MQAELEMLFVTRKEYLIDLLARVKEMRDSVKLGFEIKLSPKMKHDPEYLEAIKQQMNESVEKEGKKKKKKKVKKDKVSVLAF